MIQVSFQTSPIYFGSNASNGIIVICNALLYGFLLYYGISLLLSYLTFSQIQRPSQFIFKIILCAIALNFSEYICNFLISLVSAVSLAIRNVGENVFSTEICFSELIKRVNANSFFNNLNFNLFTFNGLIKSLVSIGFINLAISYSLRFVMIKVFVLISPFAILSLAINNFSWVFKAWIKIFLSMLFLQILVSLILLISFSLDATATDTFSQLIYIGSIYALIKANSFLKEFMGGLSTDVSLGISSMKNIISGGN